MRMLQRCSIRLTSAAGQDEGADVAGPVVKLEPVGAGLRNSTKAPPPPAALNKHIGDAIQQALNKEFAGEKEENANTKFSDLVASTNSSSADPSSKSTEGEAKVVETVVRITSNKVSDTGGTPGNASTSSTSQNTHNAGTEPNVDRIVTKDDAEFVLSSKGGMNGALTLTLDPQLILDVTVLVVAAAVCGVVAEVLQQPIQAGYLVAGAIVGPGGLGLIKELVQVQTLAQLGVYCILFIVGIELSYTKVKAHFSVSVGGGALQVILAMLLGSLTAVGVGALPSTGAFVGALLSMSSTSVVIKCLESSRSTNTASSQIAIGTLIVQDMCVGLLFALTPLFGRKEVPEEDQAEATGAVVVAVIWMLVKLGATVVGMILVSRSLMRPGMRLMRMHCSHELQQLLLIAFCVAGAWLGGRLGLSAELGAFLAGAAISVCGAGGPLPGHGSTNGGSTATLSSSISSNSLAAAHPGAGAHFHHTSSKAALGGAASGAPGSVICVADTPDVTLPLMSKAGGALLPGAATIVHRESREGSRDQSAGGMGMKGDLSVVVTVSNSNVQLGGHGGAAGGMLPVSSAPGRLDGVEVPWHGGPPADERQDLHSHGISPEVARVRDSLDAACTLLGSLFIASIGLLVSPRFLLRHLPVLALGTLGIAALKCTLIASVVRAFGPPWRTALTVGVILAHTGEFSFILLSIATQLNILGPEVHEFLLGTSALSLLTTPPVVQLVTARLTH